MKLNICCIFEVKSYSITKAREHKDHISSVEKVLSRITKPINPPMSFPETSHFAKLKNLSGKYKHTNSPILIEARQTQ